MPLSIRELFASAGLNPAGVAKWGELDVPNVPGIYCVSLSADAEVKNIDREAYLPSASAYTELMSVCPQISVDGALATPTTLADRIGRFWIPNEPVLYIGMAGTSIRTRVGQYYSTKLGARAPHAGGWWLKTLDGVEKLYIHHAPCDDVSVREQSMLTTFASNINPVKRNRLFDTERVAPFANIAVSKGRYKRHGLSNYKLPTQEEASGSTASSLKQMISVPNPAEAPADGLWIKSQPVNDQDRTRSYLRIPAAAKHAFPGSDAQVKVNLDGVVFDAPWRSNGARSGKLGVGFDYMRGLHERNECLRINFSDGIYIVVRRQPEGEVLR